MNLGKFLTELRRRNVYKVAVAYLVAAWALAQGIAQVLPVFDVPNWVIRLLILLIIVGCPIALILAWTFELTPEGIKRTETADAMPEELKGKNYLWLYVIIIGGLVLVGLFFWNAPPEPPGKRRLAACLRNQSRFCRSKV